MVDTSLISAQQAIRLYKLARDSEHDDLLKLPDDNDDIYVPPSTALPTCRICRVDSVDGLIETPCDCKGTMGYIHRKCMKIWHYKRKSKVCEICNKLQIDDTASIKNYKTKIYRVFKHREYLWRIASDLINFSSITIMVFCNLSESLDLFDHIVDQNHVSFPAKSLIIQGVTLYSGYFLHLYFLWAIRTYQNIRSNIFRVKWVFDNEELMPPQFDDDSSVDSFGFETLFRFP